MISVPQKQPAVAPDLPAASKSSACGGTDPHGHRGHMNRVNVRQGFILLPLCACPLLDWTRHSYTPQTPATWQLLVWFSRVQIELNGALRLNILCSLVFLRRSMSECGINMDPWSRSGDCTASRGFQTKCFGWVWVLLEVWCSEEEPVLRSSIKRFLHDLQMFQSHVNSF